MRTRIIVVLAVLVLAGCGGGDDTPDAAAEVPEAVTADVEAARDEGDLTSAEEAALAELEAEFEDLLAEAGAGGDPRARFSAYDDTPCVTGATFGEGEGCVVEGVGHFYVDATSGWGEFSTYAWPEADGNYTETRSNSSVESVGVLAQHDEDIDAWLITLTQGESRPGAGYPACEVDMVLTSNDQGCAVAEVGVFYVDANGRGALNASYWDTEYLQSSRSDVTKSDLDLDRLGLVVLGTSETGVWTINELPEPGKLYEVIGAAGVPLTRNDCEHDLVHLLGLSVPVSRSISVLHSSRLHLLPGHTGLCPRVPRGLPARVRRVREHRGRSTCRCRHDRGVRPCRRGGTRGGSPRRS